MTTESFQKATYFGEMLLAWREWLETGPLFGNSTLPAWVAYEEVMTKNKYHAEQHFGMVGILALECYQVQIPLIGINTMTMKKQIAGSGRAKKEQMLAEIQRRYPEMEVPDHDAADAVAVGLMALSKIS